MNATKDTLKFFWKYTWSRPKDCLLASTVIFQYLINVILLPMIIATSIGKLVSPKSTRFAFSTLIIGFVFSAVLAILFNRISQRSIDTLEQDALVEMNIDVARHILNESYEFHSKSFSGALISQATKLSGSYIGLIDTVFLEGLRTVIVVVFSSAILAFYDVRLSLIMATSSILGVAVTTFMVRKRYPFQKDATEQISIQTAYFADMITNAITVKTFASEKHELESFKKIVTVSAKKQLLAWSKQIDASNVTLMMVSIMNLSILSYGIYAVQNGFLAPGIFIAAQLYAVRLSGTFWDTSRMIRSLERVFSDAHEMVQIMKKEPAINDEQNSLDLQVQHGAVNFDNVTFYYNDTTSKDSVLANFNLAIKPGEKVGLVGRSGGGKSTITKLVLRFMDIQIGQIAIDGQDITTVTQSSLRAAIAYVPQEPLLFHRSIYENINYGNDNATKDQVIKAAKFAQADEFIRHLPKQYDTEVGERGVKLSGGQRQRIAIARALLKDSPILVLDEATSALDSESEISIQKALWKLMENRTALVIAHRLSTIQKMDRIIVVDEGKIIEQGNHVQLLKNNGTYAKLWAHQSGGFIEE
ncbi:MAG: ABC transporter ATP-binding protein [Candidatus Saccharibacteria bacterium]